MRTLIKFWLKFRLFWSKWRWRKAVTEYPLAERHIFHGTTPEELYVFILNLTNELHAKFKYTYDDITQLADSMKPPAQCYKEFIENGKFEDDCDGYHAVLYHVLQSNNIECCFATAVPVKEICNAHTFLIAKVNSNLAVIDYTEIEFYNSDNAYKTATEYYGKQYGECVVQIDKYDCDSKHYYKYEVE